jgi:putative tryptophan/tyrosine transport system substrate-binding protein
MRKHLAPLLAILLAAWPLAAGAQQPRVPVVGFLGISNPERAAPWLARWHQGLREAGFIEGRNLSVEYRWADSDRGRIPALVADLIGRGVDVFVSPDPDAATAAKKATTRIPVVFVHVADPVAMGLVESHNRPGGNVTGIANFEGLAGKKLQLLQELVPATSRIGYLVDHDTSFWPGELERVIDAGRTLGIEIILLTAKQPEEIEPALAAAKRMGIGAILVQKPSTLFFAQRQRILDLVGRYALPATCPPEMTPADGCLFDFNPADREEYLAGILVGRILNGAKPAEFPVMQPAKIKLAINLNTAKALGLIVTPALLARIDEVIE